VPGPVGHVALDPPEFPAALDRVDASELHLAHFTSILTEDSVEKTTASPFLGGR
jgi:hypothetical protein